MNISKKIKLSLTALIIIIFCICNASAAPINIIKNPYLSGIYTNGLAENWASVGTSTVILSENTDPAYTFPGYSQSQHINVTSEGDMTGVCTSGLTIEGGKTYLAVFNIYQVSGSSIIDLVYGGVDHFITVPDGVGWKEIRYTFTPESSGGFEVYIQSQTGKRNDIYLARCYVEKTEIYLDSLNYNTTNTTNINVTVNNVGGVARSCTYTTTNNTATSGTDYTAISGTLSFSEGETVKNLTIPITGADIGKLRKTFSLSLSGSNVSNLNNVSTIYIKPPAGIAFVLDDAHVDNWYAQREFMNSIDADVTFAISHTNTLTQAQITKLLTLQSDGHEIADHTLDHTGATGGSLTPSEYATTCSVPNLELLKSLGFAMPVSFVYPGGLRSHDTDVELLKYHPIVRGVITPNGMPVSSTECYYKWDGARFVYGTEVSKGQSVTLANVYSGLDKAKANGDVIVLFSHNITDTPSDYDISITNFQSILQYAHDIGLAFYTLNDLVDYSDFSPSTTQGAAPLTVQFRDTSSIPSTKWAWDFENDGVIDSNRSSPVHVYGEPGTYTVNMTVTNAIGEVTTVQTDCITVTKPTFAEDPLAWFNWVWRYMYSVYVGLQAVSQ
jgi:hypothetical protein